MKYWDKAITICVKQCPGDPNHCNKARKKNKRHLDWKGRSKTMFSDDTMFYLENPKEYTKQIPELISEFSKIARYKDNIEINYILYASSKQ